MRILITAGSTEHEIDCARALKFFGEKPDMTDGPHRYIGEQLARYFWAHRHKVVLLTSSDRVINFDSVLRYRTHEELKTLVRAEVTSGDYDLIIHSAMESDYEVFRILTDESVGFRPVDKKVKINSSCQRIYLELLPATRLADLVRKPWGFKGKFVKFLREAEMSDEKLLEAAEASRAKSDADYVVANCLDRHHGQMFIVGCGPDELVSRGMFADALSRKLGLG